MAADKIHSHKPLSKRNLDVLEDSANSDRELSLTALADVATILEEVIVPLVQELVQREYRWEDNGYTCVFKVDGQSASFEEIDRLDFSRYLLQIDVQGLMKALHVSDLRQLVEEVKDHFSFGIMEHFLKKNGIAYSTYYETNFD